MDPIVLVVPTWAWRDPRVREVYGLLLDEMTVAALWNDSPDAVRRSFRQDTRPPYRAWARRPVVRAVTRGKTARPHHHRTSCKCANCREAA